MNVFISGNRQFVGKNAIYEKCEILREMGHHPVTSFNLASRFLRLNGRYPTEQELSEERLEALSTCGGILFIQNKEKNEEAKSDYEYAKEHNLVIFDIFRLSPFWS